MCFEEYKRNYFKEHKAVDYGKTEKEVKQVCDCVLEDFEESRKKLNIPKKNVFYAYYNDCIIIKNDEKYKKLGFKDIEGNDEYMSLYDIFEMNFTYAVELLNEDCIFYPI